MKKECDLCQRALLAKQFHVFGCQHVFHSDCLMEKLLESSVKATRIRFLTKAGPKLSWRI